MKTEPAQNSIFIFGSEIVYLLKQQKIFFQEVFPVSRVSVIGQAGSQVQLLYVLFHPGLGPGIKKRCF